MSLIALISIVLFICWIQVLRISSKKYPHLDEETVFNWKLLRIRSCRFYTALYLIYFVLIVISGLYLNSIIKNYNNLENISFFDTPFLFQFIIYFNFCIGLLFLFLVFKKAYNNYNYGKKIGIYN